MAVGIPSSRLDTWLGDFTGSYMAMHVGDPGAAGTSNTTASVASRKAVTFGAAATNSTTRRRLNSAIVRWDGADVTGTATLSHWSLWTASSGGSLLQTGTLASTVSTTSGVPIEVAVGALEVNVGPLAS